MAGSYKIFKTILLLFGLVHVGKPQPLPTFELISQNFCEVNLGEEDNLSCIDSEIGGVDCFDRDLLCNGNNDCTGGEDEGVTLAPLECK